MTRKHPVTKESKDEQEFWRNAIYAAQDAYYGATCYIPPLCPQEIWQKNERWIYDRFERLGSAVLTGVTTEHLIESVYRCSYVCHAHRSQYEALPPSWLRPGTGEYIREAKRVGLIELRQRQQAFLDGTQDVHGGQWCGFCSARARMIDIGESLGYPDAHAIYALPELRNVRGFEAWQQVARTEMHVAVETLANLAAVWDCVRKIA